jgi:hypothetical protein
MTSPTPGTNIVLSADNGVTLADNQLAKVLFDAGFGDSVYGLGTTVNTVATAIGLAESGGITNRVSPPNSNGTIDRGIMQINSVHTDLLANWWDPVANAKAAFTLFQAAGGKFTPWSSYNSGAYKLFLPRAGVGTANRDNAVPVQSASQEAGSTQTDVGGKLTDPLVAIGNFLGKITSVKTWASVGLILLGATMIIIIAVKLTAENPTIQKAAKTAGEAALL